MNFFSHYLTGPLCWMQWLEWFELFGTKSFFVAGLSFNQPRFCPSATWDPYGITFANTTLLGANPYGFFGNINNTIYAANTQFRLIQVWLDGNNIPTTMNTASGAYPLSIFVTITDDIYISTTNDNVEIHTINLIGNASTLFTYGKCYDLFIDSNNSLYCCLKFNDKIIKRSLDPTDFQTTTVAGGACSGFFVWYVILTFWNIRWHKL